MNHIWHICLPLGFFVDHKSSPKPQLFHWLNGFFWVKKSENSPSQTSTCPHFPSPHRGQCSSSKVEASPAPAQHHLRLGHKHPSWESPRHVVQDLDDWSSDFTKQIRWETKKRKGKRFKKMCCTLRVTMSDLQIAWSVLPSDDLTWEEPSSLFKTVSTWKI